MARRAAAALICVTVAVAAAAACSDFAAEDNAVPEAGAGADQTAPDVANVVDAADAADATDAAKAPYCNRDAAFCADFPRAPATLNWDSVQKPEAGSFIWSEAGATEPGAFELTTPLLVAGQNSEQLNLRRDLSGLPGKRARIEMAVRFDVVPDFEETAPLRFIRGNLLLYFYYSQTGYEVADSYYVCDAGPCMGGRHSGIRPPIALGTWDRIAIVIEPDTTGAYKTTFTSESGENISFTMNQVFSPDSRPDTFIAVGVPAASPSTSGRKLVIDDVSLTLSP